MTRINFLDFPKALVLSATILLVNITQFSAQPQPSNTAKIRFVQLSLERQPENRGAPRDRKGAGTRHNCPVAKKPLTALVPLVSATAHQTVQTSTTTTQYALSLTTVEHPTFWFYVPYLAKNITSAKFVLLDEKNNSLTTQPIPMFLPHLEMGVRSHSLPREIFKLLY